MNLYLLEQINGLAGEQEWLDTLGVFLAQDAIFVLFILMISLWFMNSGAQQLKNRYAIILGIETAILARGLLTPVIRMIYPQVRPFVADQAVLLIAMDASVPSFPSGHAVLAFAMAIPALIYSPKYGFWLMILALLVGFGRVFVGVHYPIDILGGFIVALITVLFLNYNREKFVAPLINWLNRK